MTHFIFHDFITPTPFKNDIFILSSDAMFTTGRPALNKLSSGYTAKKLNFSKFVANIDYVNVE